MDQFRKTDSQAPIANRDPVIEAYKKDIDRSLIRENLRLTVDQRFHQLMKLQEFAEELKRAGKEIRK
ncbi:MAG TPA: hypothetical protein VMM84_09105 [Pyrinomonadaceae bacterium]|nr:hypothetical protein [Pyrinomonadaceae bacterium]